MSQCNLLDCTQEPSDEALAGLMHRVTLSVIARAAAKPCQLVQQVSLEPQLTSVQIAQKIKEETLRVKAAWALSHRKSA